MQSKGDERRWELSTRWFVSDLLVLSFFALFSRLLKFKGPPPGGYPAIQIARNLPDRGPSGLVIFGVSLWLSFFVCYFFPNSTHRLVSRRWALDSSRLPNFLEPGGRISLGGSYCNRQRKAEKRAARIDILPLIQAEEDRRYLRVLAKEREREAEIMKNVPGWVPGKSAVRTHWVICSTSLLTPEGAGLLLH